MALQKDENLATVFPEHSLVFLAKQIVKNIICVLLSHFFFVNSETGLKMDFLSFRMV